MTRLQIELAVPDIAPVQSLTGWRREICIELHGNGAARVFVRAVETGSLKAAELQRGILFHRMDPRFADLASCIEAIRPALESLADTAQRVRPNKDNLFVSVIYDRAMWERVQDHIDQRTSRAPCTVLQPHRPPVDRSRADGAHAAGRLLLRHSIRATAVRGSASQPSSSCSSSSPNLKAMPAVWPPAFNASIRPGRCSADLGQRPPDGVAGPLPTSTSTSRAVNPCECSRAWP